MKSIYSNPLIYLIVEKDTKDSSARFEKEKGTKSEKQAKKSERKESGQTNPKQNIQVPKGEQNLSRSGQNNRDKLPNSNKAFDQQTKQQQQSKNDDKIGISKFHSVEVPVGKGQSSSASGPSAIHYQLKLFDHLIRKQLQVKSQIEGDGVVHLSTMRLSFLFRSGTIRYDDDRVAALISSFCDVIDDYKTPHGKSLQWDLDKHIRAQVQHLVDSRPLSIGMGNTIKYLRSSIASIPPEFNEADAKSYLIRILRNFLEEKIVYAREGIIKHVKAIIKTNDVVLTFGSSPLLRQVLLAAISDKNCRLVVVDTRPLMDGLDTLTALSSSIRCVYTSLAGVASVMRDVTHVLVGASALLSNGTALAPAGTAMVAALARSKQIPFIVVAETYKFSDKVQIDSIVSNELGNIDEIAVMNEESEPVIQKDRKFKGMYERVLDDSTASNHHTNIPFQVVNLRYDLVPMKNISAIATENGIIPPTSIPVLIREI
jgi:translation initiation factor eIF-2B subunit delta